MTQIGQSTGAGCSSYGGPGTNGAAIGDAAKFQQSMKNSEKASEKTPSSSSEAAAGGPSAPETDGAKAPSQEQVQKEMFSSFAKGLDPEVQKRLSKWLPDVLNGGKKDLKEAIKDLGKQEAKDLDGLAEAVDLKHDFGKVKDRDGLFSRIIEKAEHKGNKKGLEAIKQAYGEHALKASTPGLAPAVSYDSNPTLDASREAVYEKFVSGLSEAKQERLAEWLPDVLFDGKSAKKATKKLSDKEEDALKALAKDHGVSDERVGAFGITFEKDHYLLENLEAAFKRDLALETTGELPSVVDMLLAEKFGRENGDTAVHIDLKDDKILKEAKAFKKDFGDLDTWLPDVLAGRGEMPEGDKAAKKLLVEFAEAFGFDPKKNDNLGERAEKALTHLEKQDVIGKTLHPGKDGKDSAFLLFTDRFMESTLAYGAKNGALNQPQLLDAANVAEMLLGPDDGSNKPQDLEMAGLQAAILHRTDKKLVRPQEVMAASGYINAGETLTEQKTRLTEVVLAFHVREKIGTPPMTPLQWAKNYADLNPEMLDDLGNLAFNSPAGEKMQIITQHLGVPGDHKFMINKKHKVKIENDKQGNLEYFDRDTKKTKWYNKVLDIAVPVIGTVLTFVPGTQAIGIGINAVYGAYKGGQAIKHGDLLGGLVSIAGALPGLGVGGKMLSLGSKVASGTLQTYRAIENKDWTGALAGGLSTFAAGGGHQGLQTAATGINTAGALKDGDLLEAGSGFASMASDLSRPGHNPNQSNDLQDPHSDTSLAFNTLSSGLDVADGIQEGNYAQIGGGLSSGIGGFGQELDYERRYAEEMSLPPESGIGGGPNIRQAGYQNPAVEVVPGDTLSQIAERHDTTVEALMAANPEITDRHTIAAGKQLNLPSGVQPVGLDQQDRLREFAEMQGGGTQFFPSPPRPEQGNPMLQPGATHPNADPHTPVPAEPVGTHPNAGDHSVNVSEKVQVDPTRLSTRDRLDELDQQLLEQIGSGEMPVQDPHAPGSNATPYVNTPGNPTGMRPNLPAHSDTVMYSADGLELNETPFFAGPEQTQSYGFNFDLPIVGDGTLGVTFEYGEEYDFGVFGELGPVWSPYAIDDGYGLSIPSDFSVGLNAYANKGYVPFETGIVDTKEYMAQYGLGMGLNVNDDGLITSSNGYYGLGVGGSKTYDRTFNGSTRDGLRWIANQVNNFGRKLSD